MTTSHTSPTISVIVPIYNAEQTLARCLDSLLQQSFKDFELILVNDGSTDTSGHICRQYAATHTFVSIIDQANHGVSAARNAGIDIAQGEFITFVDADDEVTPQHLATFMALSPSHDLRIQSLRQIDSQGTTRLTTLTEKHYTDPDGMAQMVIEAYLRDIPISACNSLFRRDIIQTHHLRFDERMRVCEDVDFVIRYLLHSHSVYATSAANYIYHSPSSDKTYKEQNALRTCLKLIDDTQQLASDPKLQQVLRGFYLDWCIEELLQYTPTEEAPELATRFGILCQPHLHESRRPSFRHRLFKHLCISSSPRAILLTAKTVMAIYRLLQTLKMNHTAVRP